MKQYVKSHNLQGSGKTFIGLVSGANMNFGRLRFVAERAELGEKREALLQVEIPERPGSFLELHSHIHPRPLTEFSYRYNNDDVAQIFLSFFLDGKLGASNVPASAVPPVSAAADPAAVAQRAAMTSQAAGEMQAQAIADGFVAQTPGQMELQNILTNIRRSGFKVTDISDNEMAKSHARYMVGGRAKVPNERLFRFGEESRCASTE